MSNSRTRSDQYQEQQHMMRRRKHTDQVRRRRAVRPARLVRRPAVTKKRGQK